MNLDGQVALVTGASRGIGRAIAVELASQGAIVIGTATSDAGSQAISQYLAETREGCGRGMVLDVNDAERCNAIVSEIHARSSPSVNGTSSAMCPAEARSRRVWPSYRKGTWL